ncbi:nuclear transport factor 2 family protein [Spirosoma taeanense]|uniref:Nuclear transport factor 2 family protein n=1 Tax=Spirosoma taeanense TaxID=2735870 RepID=A0A6M5YCK9_9BACT|nr:nuclear transport factor 2 family protein [Spirosoma taeanense]QJW90662.1 nuclear transport factor 2 family protein [Spirosoma taeanense]
MQKLLTLFLFTCLSKIMYAQIRFDELPKAEQEEIMKQAGDINKVTWAKGLIAITPDGKVWDKQTYKAPVIPGDSVKYNGTPETEFIYRSFKGLQPPIIYVYNGNTIVVHGLVEVHAERKGQPIRFTVARLETYIKTDGRWALAAGSGTYVEPPTPEKK